MKEELSMNELNAIFYGAKPVVEAKFYDYEVVDVPASKEAGHEVRKMATYVHTFCRKEGTENKRPLREGDAKQFKQAWEEYAKEQENERLSRPVAEVTQATGSNGSDGIKARYIGASFAH